jgi:hypothetical protein
MIKEYCQTFLEQSSVVKEMKNLNIYFLRSDGILIYSLEKNTEFSCDQRSLGALISGIGQAALSVMELIKAKDFSHEFNRFKFSFETSDCGLFLLPIKNKEDVFFMAVVYEKQVNPAALKNKLRNVFFSFIKGLEGMNTTETNKKNENLFENITDDEINELFSFAGI